MVAFGRFYVIWSKASLPKAYWHASTAESTAGVDSQRYDGLRGYQGHRWAVACAKLAWTFTHFEHLINRPSFSLANFLLLSPGSLLIPQPSLISISEVRSCIPVRSISIFQSCGSGTAEAELLALANLAYCIANIYQGIYCYWL